MKNEHLKFCFGFTYVEAIVTLDEKHFTVDKT